MTSRGNNSCMRTATSIGLGINIALRLSTREPNRPVRARR